MGRQGVGAKSESHFLLVLCCLLPTSYFLLQALRPVAWRPGFVAFGGAGEVFVHPKEIRMNNLKFAAGIGLRYQFSRSEKINIRVDYGIGRDSSGDYIDLNEAF